MSAFDDFVRAVEAATGRPGRRLGGETRLLCPVHGDSKPSLDVREGDDGTPLTQCRSQGCSYEAICAAIGWPGSNGKPDETWTPHGTAVAVYPYHDADGRLLFEVCRTADKQFPQRRPDPTSKNGWRWNLDGVERVLFRLPDVVAAASVCETIYVVEGEKDVFALLAAGAHTATCNPGGAGKWRPEYAEALAGADVVIVADDDEAGIAHARTVATSLVSAGIDRRIVLPASGKDASDHFAAGHGIEDFLPLEEEPVVALTGWLERASDLLREPDPGPTPFLVSELIVAQAIATLVGAWKVAKSYALLEIAVSIVTGRKAFEKYEVMRGPVVLVMEESGRSAFYRRLDMLRRGYALDVEELDDLHFAANVGVRLNDASWQQQLLDVGRELRPRAIMLDPLARLKGATVDEKDQREIGPVLDFMRALRDDSGAAVIYSHHTGHTGSHQRGSSDLEGYWESRLQLTKEEEGLRTIEAAHREAESGHRFQFALGFDSITRTLRMRFHIEELEQRIREELARDPALSANAVFEIVKGHRPEVLRLVKMIKEDSLE